VIAPEGKLIVFLLIAGVVLLHVFFGSQVWPLWGGVVVLVWLYREPHRTIPSAPLGIVSPVDGTVTRLENGFDPFLKRDALCLSLQMHWYGVYALRSITEGKIMQHWLHHPDDESRGHLQHAIWIQTDEGDDVVIALHAGGHFRRMHCYAHAGERIGQGKRCGFIPFGTMVDIYLPTKTRSALAVGDSVAGGTDLIAEFVH
jgi:phosphatidylserine decarboxylase